MWQLLKPMLVYNEKKHYHVGKKVADIGFTWHPDSLLQPNDISDGISLLYKIPLITLISKTTERKSIPSSNHV